MAGLGPTRHLPAATGHQARIEDSHGQHRSLPVASAHRLPLVVGGSWIIGAPLNPFLFIALLYVVTMRSRLAVDLANALVKRGHSDLAFRLYDLALAWWPDGASRLIVLVNKGAAQIYRDRIKDAIATLEGVLEPAPRHRLGLKYEAGQDARSVTQYNEAIDVLPGSLYAQAAKAALKRRKQRGETDKSP